MVDTAIFSIFHRMPAPAAPPPPPEPIEVVAEPAPEPASSAAAADLAEHQPGQTEDTAAQAEPAHASSESEAEAPESHPATAEITSADPELPPASEAPAVDDVPPSAEPAELPAPESAVAHELHPDEVPGEPEDDAFVLVAEPTLDPEPAPAPADAIAEEPTPHEQYELAPIHEDGHWQVDAVPPEEPAIDDAPLDAPPPPPPVLHAPDLPVVAAPEEPAAPRWQGPAALLAIPMESDQLGLANPIVITVLASLRGSSAIELDASESGIYRPPTFRAAPWSGFAYDQAIDGRSGVAAGTRILTSRGEVEVERLLPGDSALTLRAPALLPIAWIGKSTATDTPIWFEAGALGPDLPRRPLCLAPDQPVYVEPIPVPARRLVNGTTIRFVEAGPVDLFHVDVGKSEILFAEGVPLSSSDRARLHAI